MSAGTRNQTSIEGGLYELVARGEKDKYFIKDDKEALHPFNGHMTVGPHHFQKNDGRIH
jgi:hypothetical protein